jgi:hypothetical protein
VGWYGKTVAPTGTVSAKAGAHSVRTKSAAVRVRLIPVSPIPLNLTMSPMSQSVSVSLAAGDIRTALLIRAKLYPVADHVSLALLALGSFRHLTLSRDVTVTRLPVSWAVIWGRVVDMGIDEPCLARTRRGNGL